MKEKKHIDELFKEPLNSFEAMPSPEVWDNIAAQLKKEKDDRKVIPLWWKLGGVAAVLALLLTVLGIFTPNDPINNNIVEQDNKVLKEESPIKENSTIVPSHESNDAIVNGNENSEITPTKEDTENWLPEKENTNNTVVSATQQNPSKTNSKKQWNVTKGVNETKEAITSENSPKSKKAIENSTMEERGILDTSIGEKEGIAVTSEKDKNIQKELKDGSIIKEGSNTITLPNKTEDGIAQEQLNEEKKEVLPSEKKSIFDAIEENKEKEAQLAQEDKEYSSWEVTPNVGPVFYNSLNGGSSISPDFADNPQTSETNMSYGVQLRYNLNDRLSVRTGINNVNVGYSTGDVVLATAPTEVALKSVNYDGKKKVLSAFDKGSLNNIPPADPNNPFSQITLKSFGGSAEIAQSISYYEVPMEVSYALLNNRFGIRMIGGFSTLFLGNNEIYVKEGDFKSLLGEANNLNSLSFSTNLGLGFDYKISKRLAFNVEPIFKYQLNPYSDSSVDFNPYYFGLYSGLSFKF
ncbi:MAG: outer membrane beta-barrel protein [Flavobacteriaceae bacterium]